MEAVRGWVWIFSGIAHCSILRSFVLTALSEKQCETFQMLWVAPLTDLIL